MLGCLCLGIVTQITVYVEKNYFSITCLCAYMSYSLFQSFSLKIGLQLTNRSVHCQF
jgi:hypothetical protein